MRYMVDHYDNFDERMSCMNVSADNSRDALDEAVNALEEDAKEMGIGFSLSNIICITDENKKICYSREHGFRESLYDFVKNKNKKN